MRGQARDCQPSQAQSRALPAKIGCNDALVGTTSCHNDGDWPSHQIETYGLVSAGLPWISAMIAHWDPTTGVDGETVDSGPSDASRND